MVHVCETVEERKQLTNIDRTRLNGIEEKSSDFLAEKKCLTSMDKSIGAQCESFRPPFQETNDRSSNFRFYALGFCTEVHKRFG